MYITATNTATSLFDLLSDEQREAIQENYLDPSSPNILMRNNGDTDLKVSLIASQIASGFSLKSDEAKSFPVKDLGTLFLYSESDLIVGIHGE